MAGDYLVAVHNLYMDALLEDMDAFRTDMRSLLGRAGADIILEDLESVKKSAEFYNNISVVLDFNYFGEATLSTDLGISQVLNAFKILYEN